jgi:type IV secretion system protein VirD4
MSARSLLRGLLALAVLAALLLAWAYLAGYGYFLLNQARPANVGPHTWQLYWQAYGHDPLQRKRLLLAAALPALVLLGMLLAVALALRPSPRPLYGDARWATTDEIREAGLL